MMHNKQSREKYKGIIIGSTIEVKGSLTIEGSQYLIKDEALDVAVSVYPDSVNQFLCIDENGDDIFIGDTVIFSGYGENVEKQIVRKSNGYSLLPITKDIMVSLRIIDGKGNFTLKK